MINQIEPKKEGLSPEIVSSLVLNGDLSKLNSAQKVEYYNRLCDRIGLDPATQPFKLITLQGKQVLYADKGATQQLSQIYGISHEVTKKEKIEDVYVVTVRAKKADGRYTDEDGAVNVAGLKGDALANAMMKCVTKAKRRAVLALLGLAMLDETELDTIQDKIVTVQTVSTETISEKQMHTIRDMLIELGLEKKEDKFLAYLGVTKLEDLLAADYQKAIASLEAKRSKKEAVKQ